MLSVVMLNIVLPSVIMVNVVMLSVILLKIFLPSVINVNFVMLSVVMLNVTALSNEYYQFFV